MNFEKSKRKVTFSFSSTTSPGNETYQRYERYEKYEKYEKCENMRNVKI